MIFILLPMLKKCGRESPLPMRTARRGSKLSTPKSSSGKRRAAAVSSPALKEAYRRALLAGTESARVKLVYLKGTYELFSDRVLARKGHFAKQDLLSSQFATLEEPSEALVVDTRQSPEKIVANICRELGIAAGVPPTPNSS
jgi:carbohydrate kinase (thermoresistant glucokinase family)